MPSVLKGCANCNGRFAPQYFLFHSEICRLCLMAEKLKEYNCENGKLKETVKVLEEKVKVLEENKVDNLELKEKVKVLEGNRAENLKLKEKVKLIEDFVTAHIGPDAPLVSVSQDSAAVSKDSATVGKDSAATSASAGASYAAAVVSFLPQTSNNPSRSPNQIPNSSSNFLPVRNGTKRKPEMPITPVTTRNSFGALADLVEEPEESIIIGDSLVRNQLEEFCGRAPKSRKRYCFPGAKIDDITTALEEIASNEKEDSVYVVHLGTNDVKTTKSEELLDKYKRLINTFKTKRNKFIVSGILPRIGGESQFYSKVFSTNNRLKSLCSQENVEFIDLWNHFYDQRMLFNRDGLHLNAVGSARFGRLLNDALKNYRTKNPAQRGSVAPS